MKTLGLDPSLSSTGYAILDKNNLLDYGTLTTSKLKTKDLAPRLRYLTLLIQDLINTHKPDRIVIEDVFSGQNRKVALSLSKLQGAILVTIPANYTIVIVGANASRKNVLGEGKSHSKDEVKEWAIAKYNLPNTIKSDISDAILLASLK